MHAMAVRDDADIVIGKVVGHGKSVPRNLFRRNRTGVDLQWEALIWLLTPHKLFRRAFLDEHDLRFPEGRRRLEDHVFVMRAYFERAAHLGARRLPLLPLGPARPRRERVLGPARSADLLRVHGRGARRHRRAHRAGAVPRPAVRALVPREDAQPRREGPLEPGPGDPARGSTRRCTRSPSRASPRASTRSSRSTCARARGCCARATSTPSRRSPTSRPRCARRSARRGVEPGPVAEVRLRAELDGLRFTRDGDRLLWEGADATDALADGSTRAAAAQAARQPGGVPGARGRRRRRSVDGRDGVRARC